MGLFGPSWTWEEIQRKDAIMGELRKENDRVLSELQYMNDMNSNSGEGSYGIGGPMLVAGFLALVFGVGFIACIPMLLSQLVLLDEGDPIAVEVLIWLITAGITWVIGGFKIKDKKEYKENFKMMFKYNLVIVMILMMIVDIVFFGALSSDKIWQFIFGVIFSLFFMSIWSAIIAGIGVLLVPIMKVGLVTLITRIKIYKKKKIIENSRLYKKILENVSSNLDSLIDVRINKEGIAVNTQGNKDFNIVFKSEGFSNLDDVGVIGLGELIKKNISILKLVKVDKGVILSNKEYELKLKQKSKEKEKMLLQEEKEQKRISKENDKNEKNLKKERIKNGEDW